jgi:hypothetical protein
MDAVDQIHRSVRTGRIKQAFPGSACFLTVKVKIPRTLHRHRNFALIIRKSDCIIVLILKYLHDIFMSKINEKEKGIEGGS